MEEVRVREATLEDAALLVAGNQAMALETEGKELDPERLSAGVRAALQRPERARYLVAERGGEVVGHLMLTEEWSDWRNGRFLWIQSVYVFPGHRRRGVYRALHRAVTEEAARAGDVVGVRLYVEKENHVAQRTYGELGMTECDYRMFELELPRR